MSHDTTAHIDTKATHPTEKALDHKPHHMSQDDAAKLSLEAQIHLKDHSNLWVKGNADSTSPGAGQKGHPSEYTQLKQDSTAAKEVSKDHADLTKNFHDQNDRHAAAIDQQGRSNADLAKDTNNVLDVHDKSHHGSAYGVDKKELEEMAKLPKQMLTDEQRASVNRVLKDWDKIDDLKTSGPIKLLDRDSANSGFDKRQQGIDKDKEGLARDRHYEKDMQDAQNAHDKVSQNADLNITPIQDVLNASKVQKGEGYYQVAERMLNLDHQKHDGKEIMALTKVLKEEAASEGRNVGRNDQLANAGNFDHIMQKIRGTDVPSLTVPPL